MTEETKWVIIGQPQCIWCERVRILLSVKGQQYVYFDTKDHPSLREFMLASGLTTAPVVFAYGELIGGYEATKEFLNG